MVAGKAYLAEYVAGEILFLLNPKTEAELEKDKPLTPSDIAILVASHKDAEQFKTALMHHDIPASILHQTSIFHTTIARELWTVMTAIVERSYGVMKSAIVTDIIGGTLQDDSFLEKFGIREKTIQFKRNFWLLQ
jgi:exodeoxyribonuclease V beta subunit